MFNPLTSFIFFPVSATPWDGVSYGVIRAHSLRSFRRTKGGNKWFLLAFISPVDRWNDVSVIREKRGKKMMKGSILDHWREPSFIGIVDDLSPELLSHTPREQWALFFQKRSLLCKDELIISYAKRVHSGGGSQSFNYQQIVLLKANDQDLLLGILDRKNVVRIFITLKWAWVCDLLLMNPPCIMLHDPRF